VGETGVEKEAVVIMIGRNLIDAEQQYGETMKVWVL